MVTMMLIVNQVLYVGGNTLSKAAMARGLSNFVFITYAHALGFFLLLPLAFFFHRKTPPPPITCSILMRLFLLGFICYCCSIFLFIGIRYSSPTLASAMNNLSPAFTFMLAIIFRMEMLIIRSQSSLLKIVGTLASIGGALIVIFYQGFPIIMFTSSPLEELYLPLSLSSPPLPPTWIFGGFLLFTSCIFLSLTYIVKTWITRDFPSDVLVTLIFFLFESIIAALVALVVERDTNVWIPSCDLKLTAILYGAVEFVVVNIVHTWACRTKGPVFTVMFKPLQMIIAVIMGTFFLNDTLYFGSVIGGVTIALGFYAVMKGKAEEEMLRRRDGQDGRRFCSDSDSSSHRDPLLLPVKGLIFS